MKFCKEIRFLIIFEVIFLLPFLANCQEIIRFAIYPGETVHVYSGEAISIFSDITNSGSFASAADSKIIFFGEQWRNSAGSIMPDESPSGVEGIGGTFIFAGTHSAPQYINSAYLRLNTGFPNIRIANSRDVILEGSDLMIRNDLEMETGHLILNSRNVMLRADSRITGYHKNSYIVTGTDTKGGFLIRSTLGQQPGGIVFPIGATVNSYTPASLTYTGVAQDLKVRVFEELLDKATYGIPDYTNSVRKTWHLSIQRPDPEAVLSINVQHNSNDEGAQFSLRQVESYVSRFQPGTGWDAGPGTGVAPGTLTTTSPGSNTFVNSYTNIRGLSRDEYFSVSVPATGGVLQLRIPAGISPNHDGLNDRFVIQNLTPADKVQIQIYNSRQIIVYKDTDYKNTFEGIGNLNGITDTTLPDGVYYYIININGGKAYKGYLVINRQ